MITTKDMAEKIKGPVYLLPFTPANAVIYHVLRRNRIEVLGFLDNNKSLHGGSYDGCPVLSVGEAARRDPGASFIVSSVNYADELTQQLKDAGAENILLGGRVIPPADFYDAAGDMDEEGLRSLDLRDGAGYMARTAYAKLFEPEENGPVQNVTIYACVAPFCEAYDTAVRGLGFIPQVEYLCHDVPPGLAAQLRHIYHGATPFGSVVVYCPFGVENAARMKEAYETLAAGGIGVSLHGPGGHVSSSKNAGVLLYVEEPYSAFEKDYECAFIHVRKNAGSSVRHFFGSGFSGERSAATLAEYDHELFLRYFSFAFVRNPWDRFLSKYHYRRGVYLRGPGVAVAAADSLETAESFPEAVRRLQTMPPERLRYYSQHRSVSDGNGRLLVDYIGRFEHINDSMDAITKKLGFVSDAPFPHANATKHRPYTEVYDDEMIRIVGEAFKEDIELFGYEFGKQPGADIVVNPRGDFVPVSERT